MAVDQRLERVAQLEALLVALVPVLNPNTTWLIAISRSSSRATSSARETRAPSGLSVLALIDGDDHPGFSPSRHASERRRACRKVTYPGTKRIAVVCGSAR